MARRAGPGPSERLLYLYTVLHHAIPDGGLSFNRLRSLYYDLISDYGGTIPSEAALKRMIYRDIASLEEMGIGIDRPVYGSSRYCLTEHYLPKLPAETAATLYTSMLLYRNTLLDQSTEAARREIERAFFRNVPDRSKRLQERVYVLGDTLAEPRKFGDNLGMLIRAVAEGVRMEVDYINTEGEESWRVLDPVGLVCKRSVWYLIARKPKASDYRTYRVDQMQSIKILEREPFPYPADFDLREHIGSSWGVFCNDPVQRVRLKFAPRVASRVKNLCYHPSQELIAEFEDGSVILEFHVCGLIEMVSWILQWGTQVEVLEPEELREQVLSAATAISRIYEN